MATELIQRGNPGYSKQQMQIKKASGTSPVPVAPSAPIVPVNPNTQVASTIGGKQYNAGGGLINPADIRPTTSAESIGTTPALNIPTAQPQTKTAGTNEFVTSLNQAQKSEGQAAMDRQFEMDKAAAGKSQTDLQLAMGDAATQGAKREELYKQYGVDQLSTSVAEIQNRIDATERSRQAQIQQLEQNKQGLYGGALQDEINRINRDFSKQQADDAITLSALTRNFTNMAAIADRQLEDYMAPIKANVDFQKELFKTNQSNFTQTQRDALQYKIAQDEKKQAKIEAEAKEFSDTKLEALKGAAQQGASQDIIQAIQKAKTVEDVVKAAGIYGGDVMKRELLAQQIKTEKAQQSKYYADTDKVRAETAGTTASTPSASSSNLDWLIETADSAIKLSKYSGPSGARVKVGDMLIGDTGYRQLESQTNSLRTNVLTLMTDPSVKKFFGPQMSNADVRLMTAAGTSLNPEIQSPEMLKKEAERLKDLLVRMRTAVNSGSGVQEQTAGQPQNEFSAALGTQPKIQGTAIISGINSDGSFNFNIPTNKK